MDGKTIYDLGLHETLALDMFSVKRVPGGWIYYWPGNVKTLVFVPYSNEFQPYNNEFQPIKE